MSYENAPATKMLATHCIACGRALVDSISVEAGMGPDCRDKHGYNVHVSPEARAEANKIVHDLAAASDEPSVEHLRGAFARLIDLGFERLGLKLASRFSVVDVTVLGDSLSVTFGYSPEAVAAIKAVPGRRFNVVTKTWLVPAAERRALWSALRVAFPGQLGCGPRGPFVIEAAHVHSVAAGCYTPNEAVDCPHAGR